MNSFDRCRVTEAEGWAIIEPYLELKVHNGRFVTTDKGRLSRILQTVYGDVFYNRRNGDIVSLELKTERKSTGNLFLELWSNGSAYKPGWLVTLQADVLAYYFLDTDSLWIGSLPRMQAWAHDDLPGWAAGAAERESLVKGDGRIHDGYRIVCQQKHAQWNDTWGALVPVKTLQKEVGLRLCRPALELGIKHPAHEQLPLFR